MSKVALQLLAAVICVLVAVPQAARAGQGGTAAGFTLVRVASGTDGADVGGDFRFRDERQTFSRSADRQVIVWFRWQGTAGNHKLAARWRAPNGASTMSEFDYTARAALFGAYWTLPMSPATPLGTWTIDASIDGLPAGSHTFDVTDGNAPAGSPTTAAPPAPAGRPPLMRPALYERLLNGFSYIERPPSRFGTLLDAAAAIVAPGHVVTALAALDAVDGLKLTSPAAPAQPIAGLVAWDPAAGWAVLGRTAAGIALSTAEPNSIKVGDPCYSMDGSADGTRVLIECLITGRNEAGGRPRWVVTFYSGRGMPGAPVVDQYGDVIGLVGLTSVGAVRLGAAVRSGEASGVPLLPLPPATALGSDEALSIGDLRRRGVLLAPVTGEQHILTAGFSVQGRGSATRDYRDAFGVNEKQVFTVVTWDPKERIRGAMVLRLYTDRNQLITESKPKKVDFRPGRDAGSSSEFAFAIPRSPGAYRADVLVDDAILWRGVFRVE